MHWTSITLPTQRPQRKKTPKHRSAGVYHKTRLSTRTLPSSPLAHPPPHWGHALPRPAPPAPKGHPAPHQPRQPRARDPSILTSSPSFLRLVVVSGGLALRVEEARPVLACRGVGCAREGEENDYLSVASKDSPRRREERRQHSHQPRNYKNAAHPFPHRKRSEGTRKASAVGRERLHHQRQSSSKRHHK